MTKRDTFSDHSIASNGAPEWLQTRPGERCLIHTPAAHTNGAFSMVEIISQPGDSTPVHIHRNEDEHFVIVEGKGRFLYGDKTFDLAAGESVSAMRGIPHAWCNPFDTPLRMAVLVTPGGCEEALVTIAKGNESDLIALAARIQVEVVGPPMITPRG